MKQMAHSKRVWQAAMLSGATIVGTAALIPASALAEAVTPLTLDQPNPFAQVTSVTQLSDVQPTDWAYQSLQSLVDRYGCIVGYPDGTFRGNRPLSRYEFAAGLNACMDKVNELIAQSTANLATKDDLATLQRLQEEFATELAVLRGRVDALESRTATLEAQQFSTTTKLAGEAIFNISDSFGGRQINGFVNNSPQTVNADTTNTVFQNRVRLDLNTSFTGRDRLTTRLQVGNSIPPLTSASAQPAALLFSNEGRFAHDLTTTNLSNGSFYLDLLSYRFPVGDNKTVTVFAGGGFHYHYADTISPYLDSKDGGTGAISRFAQRNPIYNINGNGGAVAPGGAGVGLSVNLGNSLRVDAGYLASAANNPGANAGLFNGNYSALGQLVFQPSNAFKIGVTYVHAYNSPGTFRFGGAGNAVGTFSGNLLGIPGSNSAVASNSYGVEAAFQLSPNIVISGWGGYTAARLINFGDAEIWNYAVALSFPDLGGRGNLAGIILGVEPTLKGFRTTAVAANIPNRDEAYHVEAFYKYQLTDNISITPGVIWLPSVNQRSANDDIFIGTLRTTFTF